MFGPNAIPAFHHRSQDFEHLFAQCQELFKEKFSLSDEAIVLFVSGSGTLANEIVISSTRHGLKVLTDGHFSSRLRQLNEEHSHRCQPGEPYPVAVHYETAESRYNENLNGTYFVDCVSSFPYYHPPICDVWTTVASKQIGAATGLSVIVLEGGPDTLESFNGAYSHSVLSLSRLYDYAKSRQTPNTPNIQALQSLRDTLLLFDVGRLRHKIMDRRTTLETWALKYGVKVIGAGPVFTIDVDNGPAEVQMELKAAAGRFNLYRSGSNVQLFLWSGSNDAYDKFVQEVF